MPVSNTSKRKNAAAKRKGAAVLRPLSGNRAALVRRMWRAAESQVEEIEARLARDTAQPLERERNARVLAVLAKTLRDLSALDAAQPHEAAAPADDDDIPRDLDELRRQLSHKLAALVAGRAGSVPGE